MIKDVIAIALVGILSLPLLGPNQLGTTTIRVPDTFEFSDKRVWDNIEYKIASHRYTTITLLWAGYGGYVFMGEQFIDVMTKAKAQGVTINVIIDGFSASMHAVVPCYASHTTLLPSGTLYFHHSFYREKGIKIYDPNDAGDIARHTQCVRAGLLRPEGLKSVMTYHAFVERLDPFSKTIIGSEVEDQP
jgi:hypothetical protein